AELAKRWEQELAKGAWTGLSWPKAYGGRELSLAQQMIFHEVYVQCGGPGRLGHIGETLLAPTLMAYGTEALKNQLLPGILKGTTYWAQGYSEPGAGSDLAGVQTRARQDPTTGEWVIDGQKVWTSWAHESDWMFVLARCEAGSSRHHGLIFLLVPLKQPGITLQPIRQITGEAEFNEVFLDGARTASSCVLGEPGQGWAVAMYLLQCERGASTLGQQAHFQNELNTLIQVAQKNGAMQQHDIRQRIARAILGLQTLRYHALRTCGDNAPARASSISKYTWSNWRRSLGELAMDVLGVEGDIQSTDADQTALQRLWLVSRADTIYAGSNEIQLNLMAERALQMPK
ncbi:MAG: acyl-CoA dehydrogenase family protein, partial [Pseudomonadota bacterium]|nr:acyl-CoA dehydrogenase family protein [Pseudomonadota bacterium]